MSADRGQVGCRARLPQRAVIITGCLLHTLTLAWTVVGIFSDGFDTTYCWWRVLEKNQQASLMTLFYVIAAVPVMQLGTYWERRRSAQLLARCHPQAIAPADVPPAAPQKGTYYAWLGLGRGCRPPPLLLALFIFANVVLFVHALIAFMVSLQWSSVHECVTFLPQDSSAYVWTLVLVAVFALFILLAVEVFISLSRCCDMYEAHAAQHKATATGNHEQPYESLTCAPLLHVCVLVLLTDFERRRIVVDG